MVVTHATFQIPEREEVSQPNLSHRQLVIDLRIAALIPEMMANYERLLTATIFPHPQDASLDRKSIESQRKVLCNVDSYQLLALVWKESEFISDEVLSEAGFHKAFEGKLTAYAVATRLAKLPSEVARTNSRIRNICIAAATFGLITREVRSETMVQIYATHKLHGFMSTLAQINKGSLGKLLHGNETAPRGGP